MAVRETMMAEEFLSRAYKIEARIRNKKEQLANLRALATNTTGNYGSEQVSHSRNTSSLENNIARIIDREKELERDIADLCAVQKEVQEVIDLVADREHRLLLEALYLNGKHGNELEAVLGVSYRQCKRRKRIALQMVETVLRTREANRHA